MVGFLYYIIQQFLCQAMVVEIWHQNNRVKNKSQGLLAGSICRAGDSEPRGCEFKPQAGADLKELYKSRK